GEEVGVPGGQFGGAVVGDGEGGGFEAEEVGADDVDVGPAEGFGGGEGAVAGADDVVCVDDDGLLLAEAGEGGGDGVEVARGVEAGVGGIRMERLDGEGFDLHG